MANEQNLKHNRTSEEAREIGRKGGIISGQKRRERKTAREFAEAFLNTTITDKKTGKKICVKDAMIQTVAKGALSGDLACCKYMLELVGEAPSQRTEITGKDGKDLIPTGKFDISKLTPEQRDVLLTISEDVINRKG